MKTIVFNGSPNKDGYTKKLLDQVLTDLDDVKIYDAYSLKVKACTDCKFCDNVFGVCKIKDDMEKIYADLVDADNIVIATPIHVASVSAPLLAIMTRFQVYFACKFVHQKPIPLKEKKGFLVVSAGSDWPKHFENVKTIVNTSFLELNAKLVDCLYQPHTDKGQIKTENIEDFKRKLRGN